MDQDCGLARRNLLNELVHLTHTRALANHVVLQVNLGLQALILASQELELSGVLYGNCGESGDGGEKLPIVFCERGAGICGIEVDDTERTTRSRKGHTEERPNRSGLIVGRGIQLADFIVKNGDAVLNDAADE